MNPRSHSPGRRIGALILRYVYLLRSSWPRIIEISYWPTMQLIIWGFIATHFSRNPDEPDLTGLLISAVLVWDSLFRSHVSYTLSFLEEMWSRNLGNLFVAPLRPWELVVGLTSISVLRTLIGIVPAALLAIPFFGVSVFEMGFPLLAFFMSLVLTGWAISLTVTGILIRYGLGAESLTWVLPFLLAPVSCIYYPVETLPGWLQTIATYVSTSHIFEGMRALLLEGELRMDLLANAYLLNLLYLVIGFACFMVAFRSARKHGLLLQVGE